MHEETKEVKLDSKVVETIQIPVYDNLEEIVDALGDVKVLALANRQNKAELSNQSRAKHTPSKAGKKKLLTLAYQLCDKDSNPENYEKMVGLIGDYDAMQSFLTSLLPEVERRLKEGSLSS